MYKNLDEFLEEYEDELNEITLGGSSITKRDINYVADIIKERYQDSPIDLAPNELYTLIIDEALRSQPSLNPDTNKFKRKPKKLVKREINERINIVNKK